MNLSKTKSNNKIYGFDYLRAIACIFVVAFHSSPLPMNLMFGKTLHVFLFACAVPIFIIMSLFLTEAKGLGYQYIINKIYRIGKIYFFWGLLIPSIIYIFWEKYSNLSNKINIFQVDFGLYGLLVNGLNFPFKVHGIYFLFFLVMLTLLYFSSKNYISSYKKAIMFLCIGIAVNIFLAFLPENFEVIRESLIPFLIYIPLVRILYWDYKNSCNYLHRMFLLLGGYVVFALCEGGLILAESSSTFLTFYYSPYCRLSIVFLAMSFVYASLAVSREIGQLSKTLKIVSDSSLGIYLIHGFIIDFISLHDFNLPLAMIFLIVLSVSVLLTNLIKDIPYLRQVLVL